MLLDDLGDRSGLLQQRPMVAVEPHDIGGSQGDGELLTEPPNSIWQAGSRISRNTRRGAVTRASSGSHSSPRVLPDLRERMPYVPGVHRSVATGPGADQVGPQGGAARRENAAPVVADQANRLTDALQPVDGPVDVLLLGGCETLRPWRAEPRQVPVGVLRR